ncbi:unnamed protein product, partial [Ceratitis capitata]
MVQRGVIVVYMAVIVIPAQDESEELEKLEVVLAIPLSTFLENTNEQQFHPIQFMSRKTTPKRKSITRM